MEEREMLVFLYGSQSLVSTNAMETDDRAPRQIFLGTIEPGLAVRIKGASYAIANAGEAGGGKPDIK